MALNIQDQGTNNVIKGGPFRFKEPLPLVIEGHHNTISIEPGLKVGKDCQWVIQGDHNVITLGGSVSFLGGATLRINGHHNTVIFGSHCTGKIRLHIQTSGTTFHMGEHTTVIGGQFTLKEPYRLIIGKDCMFSVGILVCVSDMHPIFDLDTGERLNLGGDVIIEDHVWLGARSRVLKGVRIGQGSVIGTGTIVTHDIPEHCLSVGVPARVVRERIYWTREMDGKTPPPGKGSGEFDDHGMIS